MHQQQILRLLTGHLVYILFAGVFSITPARAEIITWEKSVKEVSQNNPDLRAARASLESARLQINSIRSNHFPQLTAGLNSNYGTIGGNNANIGSGSTRAFFNAFLNASQNVFSGFLINANIHQAEANSRVVEANFRTVQARISVDLKTAYAGLLYAQNYTSLTQEITRRRKENMRMVELRFENGNENKGSVLLSKAYLKQALFDELQARNSTEVFRKQLAQVLGRDESSDLEVSPGIPESEPNQEVQLKELALLTPDHLQATSQEEAADAGVTIARAPFFPTLSLIGTLGQTGSTFFPQNNSWSVGLNLSYPFFSSGRDYFAIQAAAQSLGAATFNRESIDRALLTKLRAAWNNFYEAIQKLKVDQGFLEASTVREKIGRNKYNNGLLTFENWDIIENDLILRQKTVLQSQRDRILAEAAWEQAQGKGVIP